MPLLKKTSFALAAPSPDIGPDEAVFLIPFTNEVFRSYADFLKKMRLYRQKIWTCKVTGKMHLTYEEALISEHEASKKVVMFPEDYVPFVLHLVQFSSLNLNDLVSYIYQKLNEHYVEGEELLGKIDDKDCMCRILKVIQSTKIRLYKLEWLDGEQNPMHTSIEDGKKLNRMKLPFSKSLLKLFIRRSTSQASPWVLHKNVADKYRISTVPPANVMEEKCTVKNKLQKTISVDTKDSKRNGNDKKKKFRFGNDPSGPTEEAKEAQISEHEDNPDTKKRKYPMEDTLVEQGPKDAVLPDCPKPLTDFVVPMETFGILLMVWDFCSSFGRVLHLSPFSLEEFEEAINWAGASNLIAETHCALLSLLVEDGKQLNDHIHQKSGKDKVTTKNWEEYLCHFIELEEDCCPVVDLSKVKRGHYHKISVAVKVKILGRLVDCALSTNAIREQLEQLINRRTEMLAAKRVSAREEQKKMMDEKEVDASNLPEKENLEQHPSEKSENQMVERNISKSQSIILEEGERICLTFGRNISKSQSRIDELKRLKAEKEMEEQMLKETRNKKLQDVHFKRGLEKTFIRTNPVGKDRHHNRYWYFQKDGRLFVENADHNQWGYFISKEEFDQLISSLNIKGVRERALKKQLEKQYVKISTSLQKVYREASHKALLDTSVLRRSVRVSVPPQDRYEDRYANKWKS